MAKYQGHRSWNSWNVSLWINNSEGLYNLARDCMMAARDKGHGRKVAAKLFMDSGFHGARTPDGGRFNTTCVYEAMEGMLD